MNYFILDKDLRKSAKYLDNSRIAKMIVETAQILSTAIQTDKIIEGLYKPTHKNHPVVKWARETMGNRYQLLMYMYWLIKEYESRYNKIHSSKKIFVILSRYINKDYRTTRPALAMPDEFKSDDIVDSYRKYFLSKPLVRYFESDIPEWFKKNRKIAYHIKNEYDKKYQKIGE
jgi:hypothetical protein